MRILLVGSYAPSLLTFRSALISTLARAGHEVHVAAPDIGADLSAKLRALGASVHATPLERQGTRIGGDLAYLRSLTSLFKSLRPGLAVTYTIKPNIWGAFAGARTGTRTVALVTGLGILFTDTGQSVPPKTRAMKKLVRWLYRRASNRNWRLVFQNRDDVADFEAAGCLSDRSKIRLMNGSGVDLKTFAPLPLPATPDFLMVARLLGAKGVRDYASAALAVKQSHPQARFRLVGFHDQGPDSITKAEINTWIAGGLEYLGPSDDVRPHLAAARIFVLPSYREGTPRAVLEAMAMGRAILTTNAPGCRETVRDGINGYLVPVRDPHVLAQRMRTLIDQPNIAAAMGAQSLKMVRQKYDVEQVNAQLMADLELL